MWPDPVQASAYRLEIINTTLLGYDNVLQAINNKYHQVSMSVNCRIVGMYQFLVSFLSMLCIISRQCIRYTPVPY